MCLCVFDCMKKKRGGGMYGDSVFRNVGNYIRIVVRGWMDR